MGRVQQFIREGAQLPAGAGVDSKGLPTTDPNQVTRLVPFGAHKGYGLSLINELVAALIGGAYRLYVAVIFQREKNRLQHIIFK